MQNTPNYGLRKPGQEDFYNVDDFNANADIMDAEVSSLGTSKLDKTGDGSNVTNTFTQASTRANLVSGENQSTTFGKLMKWFADLKPVAWSGNASDLAEDASNRLVTDTEKTTWNGKASTAVATPSSNGLMSSTDKTKLDGVATNANNYVHPSTHPPSVIVQDAGNRFVTDAEKTTWNGKLDKSGGTITGDLNINDNLIVKSDITVDGNLYVSAITESTTLGSGNATNTGDIDLSESVLNFEHLRVSVVMGSSVNRMHAVHTTGLSAYCSSTVVYNMDSSVASTGLLQFNLATGSTGHGSKLVKPGTDDRYVGFIHTNISGTATYSASGCGVNTIYGIGRIFPTGTSHSFEVVANKRFHIVTSPDGEVISRKEVPYIPEQIPGTKPAPKGTQ